MFPIGLPATPTNRLGFPRSGVIVCLPLCVDSVFLEAGSVFLEAGYVTCHHFIIIIIIIIILIVVV